MKKKVALLIVILLLVLDACTPATPVPTPTPTPVPTATRVPTAVPVAPVTGMPQGTDGYPWWNDTVFYEIFVRSFYDSNGDGIGDFNGITEIGLSQEPGGDRLVAAAYLSIPFLPWL